MEAKKRLLGTKMAKQKPLVTSSDKEQKKIERKN